MVAQSNKSVDEAINEIDNALSLLNLPRKGHVSLMNSLNLIVSIIKEHEECHKIQTEVPKDSEK